MGSDSILIIGASAAGISAATEIRRTDSQSDVALLSNEKSLPYYRPFLTEYIRDILISRKSGFILKGDEWYGSQGIDLILGEEAQVVNTRDRTVSTISGKKYAYTKLIIATGSQPRVPVQGAAGKSNVFTLRNIDDAGNIRERAETADRIVIIGGGLLGLEAASVLRMMGKTVTVIENRDRILPVQLDSESSDILSKKIVRSGVDLITGHDVAGIAGDDAAEAVVLAGGKEIPCDIAIISAGVVPNIGPAADSGIGINRGIVVNSGMETSEPGIYACGDACEYNGRSTALWVPAMKQGKIAGANTVGGVMEYIEEVYPAVLNSFDTRIFSMGITGGSPEQDGYSTVYEGDPSAVKFKKMFFINDTFVGFVLIGDVSESQKLTRGLKAGVTCAEIVSAQQ